MEIEWNDEGLQKLAQDVGKKSAASVQGVFDRVLTMGAGKTPEEVKGLLAQEWESAFGAVPTGPDLTNVADELAAGRRVEARPGPVTGI